MSKTLDTEEIASAAWEAETIINFNEAEGEGELYTASPRVFKMLERRGLTPCKVDTSNGHPWGWTFTLPKWAILIKPGQNMIRIGGTHRINSAASSAAPVATRSEAS
jgi:hypothetical protein